MIQSFHQCASLPSEWKSTKTHVNQTRYLYGLPKFFGASVIPSGESTCSFMLFENGVKIPKSKPQTLNLLLRNGYKFTPQLFPLFRSRTLIKL